MQNNFVAKQKGSKIKIDFHEWMKQFGGFFFESNINNQYKQIFNFS